MKVKPLKFFLFVCWLLLIGTAIYFYREFEIPLTEYPQLIQDFLAQFGMWGPVLYIFIYATRSVIFFPATILTVVSGLVFGPWEGIIYTTIGANLSANFTYLIGRYFGSGIMGKMVKKNKLLTSIDVHARENSFILTLIMRLIFLPFDLVSYACGISKIRQLDFALGTFIGILPGIITFVLLGASFSDPRNLAIAGFFFIIGLVISKYLKKKNALKKAMKK